MYSAELKLNLGDNCDDIYKILDKGIKFKRSNIRFEKSKNSITINVEAQDQIALIAAINSVLKQIRIISDAGKLFQK